MNRLWATVVVLAAALLGLVVGGILSLPFIDSGQITETIQDGSGGVILVVETNRGSGWLWIGVPTAFAFGAIALYAVRRYVAKPS